jgi:uncharacterized protein (TIGR02265 family)
VGAKIKGAVLVARRRFVLERFGVDALASIVARLPEADREILEGIMLPASWYPAETAARLDAAIVAIMGGSSERALWELGRASADENLERFQASFVRRKSPLAFLAQTPAIYRLYYETGRREFIPSGTHAGAIVTHDAESVTVADCFTIMGWHERALEMVGARAVKITHPVCRARGGANCRYEVSWST